ATCEAFEGGRRRTNDAQPTWTHTKRHYIEPPFGWPVVARVPRHNRATGGIAGRAARRMPRRAGAHRREVVLSGFPPPSRETAPDQPPTLRSARAHSRYNWERRTWTHHFPLRHSVWPAGRLRVPRRHEQCGIPGPDWYWSSIRIREMPR